MTTTEPGDRREELALRGRAIYDRDIHPHLRPEVHGKFVVVDIETGAYEIDADPNAATARLCARFPNARRYVRWVSRRYTRLMPYRRRVRPATERDVVPLIVDMSRVDGSPP